MVPASIPPSTELLASVVARAQADADAVIRFLRAADPAPPPGEVRGYPPSFLLDLAAGLRLASWERTGLTIQFNADLPNSLEATRNAFRILAESDPGPGNPRLIDRLEHLALKRLAWAGPGTIRADVAFGTPDEDALVDALAKIFWERRRVGDLEGKGFGA